MYIYCIRGLSAADPCPRPDSEEVIKQAKPTPLGALQLVAILLRENDTTTILEHLATTQQAKQIFLETFARCRRNCRKRPALLYNNIMIFVLLKHFQPKINICRTLL